MNFTVFAFDTISSTNTEALRQARLGADEGLCVTARCQTAGRGRHGRTWVSEKDSGLYFSVVLRPKIQSKHIPLITLMAGIAVSDTLYDIGLKPDIKWVNDVLIGEKKIAGILAETTESPAGLAVVVGIGINVRSTALPPEIAERATSIEEELGRGFEITELAERLTRFIGYFYDMLADENGPSLITAEWRRRSSYFSGKRVRVQTGDGTITGTTDGLEENGSLRLRVAAGGVSIIQAGEVELLRPEG